MIAVGCFIVILIGIPTIGYLFGGIRLGITFFILALGFYLLLRAVYKASLKTFGDKSKEDKVEL